MSDVAFCGSARLAHPCHRPGLLSLDGRALAVNRQVFEVIHELHKGALLGRTHYTLQEHEAGRHRERVLYNCKSPAGQQPHRGSRRWARGEPLTLVARGGTCTLLIGRAP